MERQRGFGLIEVILAISISVGLTTGGVMMFLQSQQAVNLQDLTRDLTAISTETRNQFAHADNFDDADPAILIDTLGVRLTAVQDRDGVPTIVLFGGAVLDLEGDPLVPDQFRISLTFDEESGRIRTLCHRLAFDNSLTGIGPMGVGYAIDLNGCDEVPAMIRATYSRDGGPPTLD